MKNSWKPILSIIIISIFVLLNGCKEDEPAIVPTVVTGTVSAITSNSASMDGQVTSDGNSPVTERGIVYGTTSNPTTSNNKSISGSGIGTFSSSLINLTSATPYFARAYATNSKGTSYGLEVSFKTSGVLGTVTTNAVTSITGVSAISGGNISDDGGADISARGVCWGTTPNPTISNNKTVDGSGKGSFSSNLTGLANGTKYYVRAYATNLVGTSYGNEISFTTQSTPTLTTTAVSLLSNTSATSGGNVTSDGGASVTSRGVCWSTSPNPTTSNFKTTDGSGLGSFTSNLNSLIPITTYYVRAYATNSVGTSYGNEINITTLGVIDIDGNKYKVVTIGGQTWMAENLKVQKYRNGDIIPEITDNAAWSSLTTGAFSYFNNQATNNSNYGKLYNWFTVMDNRGLCPADWHVPSNAEWTILSDNLGGAAVAGGKMKTVGTEVWLSPNTGATNESGFSGLPAGYRANTGEFLTFGFNGFWWTSTQNISKTDWAYNRYLQSNLTLLGISNDTGNPFIAGFSIRCVKD